MVLILDPIVFRILSLSFLLLKSCMVGKEGKYPQKMLEKGNRGLFNYFKLEELKQSGNG